MNGHYFTTTDKDCGRARLHDPRHLGRLWSQCGGHPPSMGGMLCSLRSRRMAGLACMRSLSNCFPRKSILILCFMNYNIFVAEEPSYQP